MRLPAVTVHTTMLWNDPRNLPFRDCPSTRQQYYYAYCLVWNPNDRASAPTLVHITNEKEVMKYSRLVKSPSPSDPTCIPIARMHESVAESMKYLENHHPLYTDKFLRMLQDPQGQCREGGWSDFLSWVARNHSIEYAKDQARYHGRVQLEENEINDAVIAWRHWYNTVCKRFEIVAREDKSHPWFYVAVQETRKIVASIIDSKLGNLQLGEHR
jgi:hypothetical protein